MVTVATVRDVMTAIESPDADPECKLIAARFMAAALNYDEPAALKEYENFQLRIARINYPEDYKD